MTDTIIEAETRAWCHRQLRLEDPARSLRTMELRPSIFDVVDEHGYITSDSAAWVEAVTSVVTKRRALLGKYQPSGGDGRLLAYRPLHNLADGAAPAASSFFIDHDNLPPWDTWLKFQDGLLYAWIPAKFEGLAQSAVDVNPEQCIWWVDEGDPEAETKT